MAELGDLEAELTELGQTELPTALQVDKYSAKSQLGHVDELK